jgi:hypothetical protein
MKTRLFLAACALLLSARLAPAWWDTQIQVAKPPPTLKTVQAEEACNKPEAVVADDLAWGGKAARLEANGPTLAFEVNCPVSHYSLYVIARVPRADFKPPTPPVVLRLRATNLQTKLSQETRARICAVGLYQDAGHLYFTVTQPGKHRIELFAEGGTVEPILVDYLALKDLFMELPRAGQKRGQNLLTRAEVEGIRAQPESAKLARALQDAQIKAGLVTMTPEQARAWREATFEAVWGIVPPRNLHYDASNPKGFEEYIAKAKEKAGGVTEWNWAQGLQPQSVAGRHFILPAEATVQTLDKYKMGPWLFKHPKLDKTYGAAELLRGETAGDCAFPEDGTGFWAPANEVGGERPFDTNWLGSKLMQNYRALGTLAVNRAETYLKTGNAAAGWEGACALLAYVELYPDIDYQTQRFTFYGGQFGNGTQPEYNPYGKYVYSGWAVEIEPLLKAYDQLFPVIQGNAELAKLLGAKLPNVKSSQDVVTMLDTNLLQHVRDCVDRQVIRAGDGASERVLGVAALVQGPGTAADWMWQLLFSRCHMRMINRGGLQDHFTSSVNVDGSNYIGSVLYTMDVPVTTAQFGEICRRFKALGGKLQFDLSDVARFPKSIAGPNFLIDMFVAGGFLPRIGDAGTAQDPIDGWRGRIKDGREAFLFGWRATGDPRMAWMVRAMGRQGETDAEWTKIEADAQKQPADPVLTNVTRNLPGFGMVVLEAHPEQTDFRKKAALVLRTGAGQGHGHCDQLGIAYYAKGAQLLSDNGRRGGATNTRSNRNHNLVEVDERDLLCTAYGRSGVGWAEAVADLQGVGYARASAAAPSHPYLKVYRRDAVLVPVGEGDSYVFDVFRTEGGKIHTWCNEGPIATAADQARFNTPMSEAKTPLTERYPGKAFEKTLQGVAPEMLQVTWQAPPENATRFLQLSAKGAETPGLFVRAWQPGVKGLPVLQSHATVSDETRMQFKFNFVYVRKEGPAPLSTTFATVSEGWTGENSVLRSVKELPMGGEGAMAARAVEVERADGLSDLLYSDGTGIREAQLPGGVRVKGQFAYLSRRDGQITHAALVGGESLEAGGLTLKPETARYTRKVTSVDLAANAVALDRELPAGVLDGESFLVTRQAEHHASYIPKKVEGARVTMRGAMTLYQTAVDYLDEESGRITPNLPPVLLETTDTFYNNLPMMNEEGKVLGRARVMAGDRFMYLGYPEHWQWNQRLRKEELVDADGDGRKTLKLYAAMPVRKVVGETPEGKPITERLEAGALMFTLEVTRLSDDGLTFWFKDPPETFVDSGGVPHKAWPYAGNYLVTEDGKRRIIAQYPGTDFTLAVAGRKLTKEDLPDADKDGRRTVSICDLAAGDTLDAPARASARRTKPGVWEVAANCGLRVRVPAEGDQVFVAVLTGEQVSVRPEKAGREMLLPAALFASGRVFLLTTPDAAGAFQLPLK